MSLGNGVGAAAVWFHGGVRLDTSGRIDADVLCGFCGYNLRGAEPAGACAECGGAVMPSVAKGAPLIASDPRWRERVGLGLMLLVIAGVLHVVTLAMTVVHFAIMIDKELQPDPTYPLLMVILTAAIGGMSTLLATLPEPDVLEPLRSKRRRRYTRAWLLLWCAAMIGMGAALLSSIWLLVIGWVCVGCWFAGVAALLPWAGDLAERLPEDRMKQSMGDAAWGYRRVAIVIGAMPVAINGLIVAAELAGNNQFVHWIVDFATVLVVVLVVMAVLFGFAILFSVAIDMATLGWRMRALRRS